MKNQKGFAWLPVLLSLVILAAIGGGAYMYEKNQHKADSTTETPLTPTASSTPADTSALDQTSSQFLTFVSPQSGTDINVKDTVNLSWKIIDSSVLSTFPANDTYVVFHLIDQNGKDLGSIGDGETLSKNSYPFTFASYLNSEFFTLTSGARYKFRATLSYEPAQIGCDPVKSGAQDCWPEYSAADQALIDKAKQYESESGWFTVELGDFALPKATADNNPFLVTEANPTVTGSSNLSEIGFQIMPDGDPNTFNVTVPVINGRWSYTPSFPNGIYGINIWTVDSNGRPGSGYPGGFTMVINSDPAADQAFLFGTPVTLSVGQRGLDTEDEGTIGLATAYKIELTNITSGTYSLTVSGYFPSQSGNKDCYGDCQVPMSTTLQFTLAQPTQTFQNISIKLVSSTSNSATFVVTKSSQ